MFKCNATFLNKILGNRIQYHIKKIHNGKMELTQGKQGWFNIRKSIYVIYHLTKFYMHRHTPPKKIQENKN